MKNTIKPVVIAFSFLLATSCGENTSIKKLTDLKNDEKQTVLAISTQFNTLLRQKAILNFIKTAMQQNDKASYMKDYLLPNFKGEEIALATEVIDRLFSSNPKDVRSRTSENDFFNLSPTVAQLAKELTTDIKNAIVKARDEALTTDQLVSSLKSEFFNFKTKVQENTSLTFDETRALIAFAEFQNNSISETINMANALSSNSGGRTQGWFSDLISVVVTAVVAAVVVVAVVVTAGAAAGVLGAAWFGTAVAVGAIAGGVYGGVVGYDLATRGYYFTEFDPGNIGGGFLDWERCTTNPGHWACI